VPDVSVKSATAQPELLIAEILPLLDPSVLLELI